MNLCKNSRQGGPRSLVLRVTFQNYVDLAAHCWLETIAECEKRFQWHFFSLKSSQKNNYKVKTKKSNPE